MIVIILLYISILGGILGLSCGINILSIFEVMFCINRLILLGIMSLLSGRRPSTLKDMKRDKHPTNSKNFTSNDIFEYWFEYSMEKLPNSFNNLFMFSLIHYLTDNIFIHYGPIIDNLNTFWCDQNHITFLEIDTKKICQFLSIK